LFYNSKFVRLLIDQYKTDPIEKLSCNFYDHDFAGLGNRLADLQVLCSLFVIGLLPGLTGFVVTFVHIFKFYFFNLTDVWAKDFQIQPKRKYVGVSCDIIWTHSLISRENLGFTFGQLM